MSKKAYKSRRPILLVLFRKSDGSVVEFKSRKLWKLFMDHLGETPYSHPIYGDGHIIGGT